MPKKPLETIDPKLLDFVPAKLNHSDGELIDACRRLIKERIARLRDEFDYLAISLKLTQGANKNKAIRVIPVLQPPRPERATSSELLLTSDESSGFCVGTRDAGNTKLLRLEYTDEPWFDVNFRDLIRAIDFLLHEASQRRLRERRTQQAAAITALRRGNAVLAR